MIKFILILWLLVLSPLIGSAQTKDDSDSVAQSAATESAPGWASAEGYQAVADDESGEPSYSDTEEPSFGEDGMHE